jgi:Domain of unknown function (DUF4276)
VKRVHVLVDGQTEETFIRDLLGPYFLPSELALQPIVVSTKRVKAGGKFKGGITNYQQVRREIRILLRDRGVAAVTTMLDFYGLPDDFPEKAKMPRGDSCYQRVTYLEEEFRKDIDDTLFLPYLSLHEFEALLLVSPEEIGKALPGQPSLTRLAREVAEFASPEEVNEGLETHPSARICRFATSYQKRLHGPIIAERIGLTAIRERCPHFSACCDASKDCPPRLEPRSPARIRRPRPRS